jgi:hypothetical protein
MTDITIYPTGLLPIKFTGKIYDREEGEKHESKHGSMYNNHIIEIYTTDENKAVVYIEFVTTWGNKRRGERPYKSAKVVPSIGHVGQVLIEHDPCQGILGIPPGSPNWKERTKFFKSITAMRYNDAVSKLLKRCPELTTNSNNTNDITHILNNMISQDRLDVLLKHTGDILPVDEVRWTITPDNEKILELIIDNSL